MRRLKFILFSFILFLIVFAVSFFIFKSSIINYLTINQPVDADFLVVEGWISEKSLENATREFQTNNYKKAIVTGIPIDSWYFLPDDGFFIFNFSQDSIRILPGDSIKINLKGTQALGKYAHFGLFINEKKVGAGFSTEEWKEHLYISDTGLNLKTITISFDNDDYYGKEDRNLYIGSVEIKNNSYPARSEKTILYHQWDPERRNPIHTNFNSVAGIAAHKLIELGIPSDKVIILPATDSKKNRTLNSALAVEEWILNNSLETSSINLFSENIHARRSWLVYKSVLQISSDNLGVISAKDDNFHSQNIKENTLSILREIFGILYYSVYGIFR